MRDVALGAMEGLREIIYSGSSGLTHLGVIYACTEVEYGELWKMSQMEIARRKIEVSKTNPEAYKLLRPGSLEF